MSSTVTFNNVTYTINPSTKTASAAKKDANITSVIIPATIIHNGNFYSVFESYKVTSCAANAFTNCVSLTSAVIGNNVTTINEVAFGNCNNLTSVTIGTKVNYIGLGAFMDCNSLTKITIPDAVTAIGTGAFEDCYSLSKINIGKNVTYIGDAAFNMNNVQNRNYTNLSLHIPNSVTSIGDFAFHKFTGLKTVTIGSGVTSMAYGPFKDCGTTLTGVYFLGDKPSGLNTNNDSFNETPNVTVYYKGNADGWINGGTVAGKYTYPIPTITINASTSSVTISADPDLSSVYLYTSKNSGVTWKNHTISTSGGSGTFTISAGTQVSTIGHFYDATNYPQYCKSLVTTTTSSSSSSTTLSSFSFQFDSNNQVSSSTISTYLPIDNTNNSITISNINVESNQNTHTITVEYSYDTPISPDGLNFNVSTSVFDYYNNTSNSSGVSNLQILDLNTIPLSPNGQQFKNLSTLTSFASGTDTPYLYQNTTFNEMFNSCVNLQSINFGTNFNTLNVTNMSDMFNGCNLLETLVFGTNFNTVNVTHMDLVFNDCHMLQQLDVSTFDTSNVTTMYGMFGGCSALSSLDVTTFNTINVTNMSYMFAMLDVNGDALDSNLTTITFGLNFNTENVVNMSYMFSNANSLASLITIDLSGNDILGIEHWDTSNVTNMNGMFEYTNMLTDIGNLYDNWVVTDVIANNNYTGFSTNSTLIARSIPNFTPTSPPSSNVCFPATTPVLTNRGYVSIEEIDPTVHTIRNNKIVAITKTVAHDKNLVRIAKHALGKNYPEKTTIISQNHKVFFQGQMVKAKYLVNENTVTFVPYKGEILYNVLLEEHEKMQVNNLIVETLHPEHKVAKLYRFLKNVDVAHHGKLIALFNKHDSQQRHKHF